MTILEIQEELRECVNHASRSRFNVELEQIAIEVPPKTELGDLAFPAAFELAKLIKQATGEKQNPRTIAEILRTDLEHLKFVDRIEIAGPGYINMFLDRSLFLTENTINESTPSRKVYDRASMRKVCVEHTSVNPNKAAHIGHVRNSVLGDTFQRILKANGKVVEVQNYIDNTGVQVADVVVGFMFIHQMNLDAVKTLDKELIANGISFDYYCWDLYAQVGQEYLVNEELKRKRAEILHLIEEGSNETAELADYVSTRNVECILSTMERFGIRYDLLPRESEILHLKFWDQAFAQMKERGVIRYETDGKNAGCWVMPFESHSGTDEHEADKILVRSNGTITYTGKDIAYQMWKLGILGMDFHYRRFHAYDCGKEVWITTEDQTQDEADAPEFGHGATVYNVIDSRQSYPQEVVRLGVAAIHPEKGKAASMHLSYEMVALSPSAAEELGLELSPEDKQKSFLEMSGRKGLGVKADDLLNRLEENALLEVISRHPDLNDIEQNHIARQIAVGALRYFLLKFTRNTIIVFDFREALSFEGETGCFCQYSAVRANSIFRKLEERGESMSEIVSVLNDSDAIAGVFSGEGGDDIWSMFILASRLEETLRNAETQCEPALLAKYMFNLAKAFNLFYHNHKIIPEKDQAKRAVLISVADIARSTLIKGLDIMGIEVPNRM